MAVLYGLLLLVEGGETSILKPPGVLAFDPVDCNADVCKTSGNGFGKSPEVVLNLTERKDEGGCIQGGKHHVPVQYSCL